MLAFGSCEDAQPPEQRTLPSDALPKTVEGFHVTQGAAEGYVDDQACQECHAAVYDSYQSHGMARSFSPPNPENAIEKTDLGKPLIHAATGFRYVMSIRDGRYVLRRYCVDAAGREFADVSQEVAWVIGSGNHVRSYVSRNAAGELFQLPVSWYRGKGFAMSPGYDHKDHPRFERVIERGCMFCQNAYPEIPVGADLPHRSHRYPKTLPHGIGCQRCHGPGARHVAKAADEEATDEEIRRTITNPSKLDVQQQEDLCFSCHLQPESVRSKMMPRVFDRGAFSFKPGDDLAAFIKFLDHGSVDERGERYEINHHAYRLRQSTCYVQSPGKLTCTTCHDPHRTVPAAQRATHYRKVCFQCHGPTDCKTTDVAHRSNPKSSDCVRCHMPPARPTDVIHTLTTDHRIGLHKGDRAAQHAEHHPKHQPLTIRPYFADRLKTTDAEWPLFRGFGEAYYPTEASTKTWIKAFEDTKPHPVAAYVVFGRALIEVGKPKIASEILHEATTKWPKDATAHWMLGEALLLLPNQGSAAVASIETAIELDDTDPGAHAALGQAYAQAGAQDKARKSFERSLAIRPNSAATWNTYGFVLLRMRDAKAATKAFQEAIRWNPRDDYAYGMLSQIYKQQQRHDDQFRVLSQGAALLPDVKLDLIAAKFLTRSAKHRDPKGGLEMARTEANTRPKDPRALLHFALATVFEGRTEVAPRTIRAARVAGADPASCTCLSVFYWYLRRDKVRVEQLLGVLEKELGRVSQERLRRQLLAHLTGLKIR